jgi:hypothetical protein
MPANRRGRGGARGRRGHALPQHGRVEPYEPVANRERAPVPLARENVPPIAGPNAADQPMTEEDEDRLVRLALTWQGSRKLSLTLFHVDVAASFERFYNQHGEDRKMQPTEAEHKLQVIEMKWRCSPAFRKSGSRLATNVERWMTEVREVEEQERTKLERRRRRLLKDEMPASERFGDFGSDDDECDSSEIDEMNREALLEEGVIVCRTCGHRS